MLIRNVDTTPHEPVKMDGVRGASMAIMVGRADAAPNFSLRHIRVEPGGYTPRHSHDYEHEVFVVGGRGTVLLEGSERPIGPGDVVFVPPEQEHQFCAAGDEGLEFLCVIPATRDCGQPTPGG